MNFTPDSEARTRFLLIMCHKLWHWGQAMSDDVHERLKEKTLQIAQLQHQLQVLQAQLEGTQRRAGETGTKIVALENLIAEKDSENHRQ